jgi:hypothetical protein
MSTNGQMDGWIDTGKDILIYRQMDGWTDE